LVQNTIVPGRRFLRVVVFQPDVELVCGEKGDLGFGVGADVAVVCQGFLVFLQHRGQQFVQLLFSKAFLLLSCLDEVELLPDMIVFQL
jgi:hypothetical protein